jgi:hypothetical protein
MKGSGRGDPWGGRGGRGLYPAGPEKCDTHVGYTVQYQDWGGGGGEGGVYNREQCGSHGECRTGEKYRKREYADKVKKRGKMVF